MKDNFLVGINCADPGASITLDGVVLPPNPRAVPVATFEEALDTYVDPDYAELWTTSHGVNLLEAAGEYVSFFKMQARQGNLPLHEVKDEDDISILLEVSSQGDVAPFMSYYNLPLPLNSRNYIVMFGNMDPEQASSLDDYELADLLAVATMVRVHPYLDMGADLYVAPTQGNSGVHLWFSTEGLWQGTEGTFREWQWSSLNDTRSQKSWDHAMATLNAMISTTS